MRNSFIALVLLAASAAAAGQAPQPRPTAKPDEIVVIGRSQADREAQIRAFVRSLADTPGDGPLARFDTTAVCTAAVGLSETHNRAIAARMREVAGAVGIRTAAAGCRPNVLVILTRDKAQMIAALRKRYPVYFRHASGQTVTIPSERGPATAWHLEGKLDRDGQPVVVDRVEGYEVIEATDSPSRLTATARPIFMASVVVIETRALAGLTPVQVGDYAAMRAFARADPARLRASAAPTILTVLEAPMNSAVPETLTQWDLSYLKGFYASSKYASAARQRGEISKRMLRDLGAAPPERK